jgi:hypothetical protein
MSWWLNTFLGCLFGFILSYVLLIISALIIWAQGAIKPLYRLGFGLSKRSISILADGRTYNEIATDLKNTKIFKDKLIERLAKPTDISRKDLVIISPSFFDGQSQEDVNEALLECIKNQKETSSALLIYTVIWLDNNVKDAINKESNTILVNMRGRLVNDVLATLMTTDSKSYKPS